MAKKKKPKANPVGRPRVLSSADKDQILKGVRRGLSRCKAAQMLGVHPTTIANEGERDPAFLDSLSRVEAERLDGLLERVFAAGDKDHRALTWYIEKMYSDEFGPRQKIDIGGQSDNPIVIESLTDGDLERIIAEHAKRAR